MDSIERALGRVESGLKDVSRRLDTIERKIEEDIIKKIESQQQFKWKIIGACGAVSFLIATAVETVVLVVK